MGIVGRVQLIQLLRIRERSLLLDLKEYTNSSERSRIRFATTESAEHDIYMARIQNALTTMLAR